MIRRVLPAGVLATAIMACCGLPATKAMDPPRGGLWFVVRVCALAERRFGTPFPCVMLRRGDRGFAVLHARGGATHFIVTPTRRVAGLESASGRDGAAGAAWRAALDLRPRLTAETGIAPGDVALSVNPRRARSQDQLHIHVDCANPGLLRHVRASASLIGRDWTRLPTPFDGLVYWARRVGPDDGNDDPFVGLSRLPPSRIDRTNVVFASFGLDANGTGDMLQLATQTAGSSAEDILDASCGHAPQP